MPLKILQLVPHFLSSARIYSALFLSLRLRIDKYRDNQRGTVFSPCRPSITQNMNTFDERKMVPSPGV